MRVTLYVEGGGHRAALKAQLRKGFRNLLVNANFAGRLPKVVACGPRDRAYQNFKRAVREGKDFPVLLVDSEVIVQKRHQPPHASGAWQHLLSSDHWRQPKEAADDQAQLMVASMETWLVADRQALRDYFPGLNARRLPPVERLESRPKEEILQALERSTETSNKGAYKKGEHAFALVGLVDPIKLERRLPHFRRFVKTLHARLEPSTPMGP